jgi:hypothetical protein
MAITNPFSITYGDRQVGGATHYQLLGPYVIEKSYDGFRLVFDVIVVATSHASLQSLSDDLETDFRKRLTAGDTLVIDLDGSSWTYTVGETLLKVAAAITKSGNPETDRGYSRAYTVAIQGELPADNASDAGLRSVEVLVEKMASGQRTVTMRGVYTASSAGDAVANYTAAFDTDAAAYLDAVSTTATWEMATESYTLDRERNGTAAAPHLCNFTRQYVELLADQSQGSRDDDDIKDHRIVFTDLSQYPGDGRQDVFRLRRVVGNYDCAIDIAKTTDLQATFDSKVKPHLRQLFRTNFEPRVFALEDARVGYDETSKRLSVTFQFLYQGDRSGAVVEMSQSVAYREARTIDYTPTHGEDELAAEADVGWATVERVWNRTAVVIGNESPKRRIAASPVAGDAGLFNDTVAGVQGPDVGDRSGVVTEGWNIIASTSQVTPQWIGNPEDEQIAGQSLTETVVERYHRRPAAGPTRGPITPRR